MRRSYRLLIACAVALAAARSATAGSPARSGSGAGPGGVPSPASRDVDAGLRPAPRSLALAPESPPDATPLWSDAPESRAGSPDDPLVDVTTLDRTFVLEMRYATADNFLHRAVYDRPVALLRRPVAERLARVQKSLAARGLRLRIWDAYRPHSVQKEMWRIVPDERYVANPAKGSSHGRGAAVDVTLVDREGRELEMGTKHDDFTSKAAPHSRDVSAQARTNRMKLIQAMEAQGFRVIETEWWHFASPADDKLYEVLDVPLSAAAAPASPRSTASPH